MTGHAEDDEYPPFVVVCDHGGGNSMVLARYLWSDVQGVWVPGGDASTDPENRQVTTYYGGAVRVSYLEGNRMGWWHPDRTDDERVRAHHEVLCRVARCTVPPFRADEDELQTVMAVLAANRDFRTRFASKVSRSRITVSIAGLNDARAEWNRLRKGLRHPN